MSKKYFYKIGTCVPEEVSLQISARVKGVSRDIIQHNVRSMTEKRKKTGFEVKLESVKTMTNRLEARAKEWIAEKIELDAWKDQLDHPPEPTESEYW